MFDRARDRLVIVLFCCSIALPAITGAFGITGAPEFTENRRPRPFPELTEGPQNFLRRLDDYISDRTGFRALLITSVNYVKLLMNASGNAAVVYGRDGWMFGRCAWCRGFQSPYSGQTVNSYAQAFSKRAQWVDSLGGHFIFFVVPRKELLYPEFVPDWMRPTGPVTDYGVLRAALQHDPIDLFYPLDELLKEKEQGKIYYRYDGHWSSLGAFFGARALINHLHDRYKSVPRFSDEDYEIESPGAACHRKADGVLLDLLVLEGLPALSERCPAAVRKNPWNAKEVRDNEINSRDERVFTKEDPSLPTAVFFVDSFGATLKNVFAEYFRRVVFIHPWYAQVYTDLTLQFPITTISEIKPDFVVYLRTETGLFAPTGNPPEVAQFGEVHRR